ncbi:hypothetical protein EVAR_9063_1 [Eumeta japonica]|uniref:Uncharacterized protein n=1 Tax=Eumeta variegata TaxID=151549 RepID=A0A4C1TW13_EUMVA|nr:hypothetical protein EVAR_9063_1 [Eumeta japonica]
MEPVRQGAPGRVVRQITAEYIRPRGPSCRAPRGLSQFSNPHFNSERLQKYVAQAQRQHRLLSDPEYNKKNIANQKYLPTE